MIRTLQNKDNHKWIILIFLFVVVDLVTTYVGIRYNLMEETNPLMLYCMSITCFEMTMLILCYLKYAFLVIMHVVFCRLVPPYNYAMFYTVFAMSTFVAVNNVLIISWEILA